MADTPATRLNGAAITSLVSCPVPSGAGGIWWDGNTTGPKWRKADGTDVTLSAGGGSTGNFTFSTNTMDLSGAATATLFPTTATSVNSGGSSFGFWSNTGSRFTHTQRALTSATQTSAFTVNGGAHTALTASTELVDVNFGLNRTVQFSTGALTTQRAFLVQAPTYSAVGASTITNAATLAVSGAPVAGTNATITNPYALWIQGGNVGIAGNILPTTDDGSSLGSSTNRLHQIWLSGAAGSQIAGAGGSATLTLNDSVGVILGYGPNSILQIGSSTIFTRSNAADGATANAFQVTTQTQFGTAGANLFNCLSAASTTIYLGMFSGSTLFPAAVAIDVIADATCTAGNVLIWSNTNGSGRVKDATASANLTTIAGVCVVGGAAGATVKMVIRGRCFVNAVSGVTAQSLLGTSGVTAGNVVGATPGSGALVGLSLEARSATIANQVLCDVRIA